MHRIEMAVELQDTARLTAIETNDDSWCGGMIRRWPLDCKTVAEQEFGQALGDRAALAGAAGHGYQLLSRIEQSLSVDSLAKTVGVVRVGVHEDDCKHETQPMLQSSSNEPEA
jgi:hypothetical protein